MEEVTIYVSQYTCLLARHKKRAEIALKYLDLYIFGFLTKACIFLQLEFFIQLVSLRHPNFFFLYFK